MESNIKKNFYDFPNKKISINDKLECNSQFEMPNINNNILPKGNNINIDILSEVQMAQDNLNNELHDVKKVYLSYSNSNKKETPNQVLINKEKKINSENNKDINKRKNKNNFKTNSGKTIYKDIPLSKFFQ